jgi:hypothetical protein
MKRFLAPILLLILLFPALAFGETMKDLVKTDGLYYKKFSDVPFTGKITEGLTQGSFRNGKWDGPYIDYHYNGRIFAKGTYKDGMYDGLWVWYDEYGVRFTRIGGTYKNGVKIK